MTSLYYISPIGADVDFQIKRALLAEIAVSRRIEFVFPSGHLNTFSLAEMVETIRACDWVIADLSFERPSCYFEVGVAQASRKPVSLIALEGTPLHQAAGTDSTLTYRDLTSFRQVIEQAVELAIRGVA